MFKNPASISIALLLLLIGSWAIYKAINLNQANSSLGGLEDREVVAQVATDSLQPATDIDSSPRSRAFIEAGDGWGKAVQQEILSLLASKQWQAAVAKIDSLYSQASSADLDSFKTLILQEVHQLVNDGSHQSAITLLTHYTNTFDDLIAWRTLAMVASQAGDWSIAVNALLRSSAQEFETDAFNQSIDALTRAARQLRTIMERDGDQLGILALYQRLYEQHPGNSQFQLELAQAHLLLNDADSARQFLEPLQYDPDLGVIAKQKLAVLDAKRAAEAGDPVQNDSDRQPERPEIVVPLLRAGSSLLIDVKLNRRPLRMLLDTGASITALSVDTIAALGLRPTGRSIQLSTANGLRSSRLYHAKNLSMGRLNFPNLVVAEIEFGNNSQIQGLLGTDALKAMDRQFSYLIDDQRNALIFRQR